MTGFGRLSALLLLGLAAAAPLRAQEAPAADDAVTRGAYIFSAAGCLGCHTDAKGGGEPLAGGRALATPFGTFHTPNITPDPDTGIGAWREDDLRNALRHGTSPDGDPYYPAFPYTSYAGMTDADIADLYAYLMAQPPVRRENRPHDLDFPYSLRFTLGAWQWLYHEAEVFEPDPSKDAAWNRGAYLVRHLAHCGECHSPRGWLGAVDREQALAGNPQGPDGGRVPNLTPGTGGLADWSDSDIAYALKTGMTPEGDFLADSMGEVIEHGTSRLSDSDLAAIAKYIKDLPPRTAP
ncbi:MAG: c-type cytochrome [Bacteroidota bacterium]|nr:cytochrome c [Kiloniellaceae bacterium]